jgi:hypothetical protein
MHTNGIETTPSLSNSGAVSLVPLVIIVTHFHHSIHRRPAQHEKCPLPPLRRAAFKCTTRSYPHRGQQRRFPRYRTINKMMKSPPSHNTSQRVIHVFENLPIPLPSAQTARLQLSGVVEGVPQPPALSPLSFLSFPPSFSEVSRN